MIRVRQAFVLIAVLLAAFPAYAGMQIGPLTTGSSQTGGSGTAPVVTPLTCNAVLPVANGTNVSLLAGGACGYSATCAGVACTGVNAITAWAITGQSLPNAFSIISGNGILQGGSGASGVTASSYTVTVSAANSTGASPGVVQPVVVANTIPTVVSHSCSINLPVTNGVNVSPSCSYSALCDSQACVSPYALTNWAITSQSVANGFSITSAGVLQGGSGAASVVAGSPTVTITATNAVGTSPGVTQTVVVSNPSGVAPVVTALSCTISAPVTNGSNVIRTNNNGTCGYSATCSGGTCTGGNAITSWAITAQSCASCFSITSAGVLQGGTNAANVTTGSGTVTVTATNSTGTSPAVVQSLVWYGGGFQGNPVPSISAITPSITCLQTGTLQTPAFIQCSASGTTALGTSNPYIDLEYVWTTNDASADTFTVTTIGSKKANHQNGPEFANVFRSAGTWVVTLTVRGCTNGRPTTAYAGGGGTCSGEAFTVATATQNVTVAAWTGTDYFFNTSTGLDSADCLAATVGGGHGPCQTLNKFNSLADSGNNLRFNFDCGQTWTPDSSGNGLKFTANANIAHTRVQASGPDCPGAAPIINMSAADSVYGLWIAQNGSGGVKSDYVVSGVNIEMTGSNASGTGILVSGNNTGGGSLNNIYLDTIAVSLTLNINGATPVNIGVANVGFESTYKGIVLWNVSSTTPVTATTETGIIGGTQNFYSVVGGTVQGSGSFDAVRAHQIYSHCGGHCMFRWINTGPSCSGGGCTPTRDSCVKTSFDNTDGTSGQTVASYWLITENYCESVADLGGPGNSNNDNSSFIDQYIQQQNVLFEISGGSFPANGEHMVVRDNWACLTGANSIGLPVGQLFSGASDNTDEDSELISSIYRNLSYSNSAAENNMLEYDPNPDTWTHAQTIFDNLLQNNSSTGVLINIPSSNFTSVGSVIDYDTYYAPNNSGTFLQNAQSGVTFAAWKVLGWDTHGVNGNPGWSSPSTCGFGSWPYQ